MGPLCKLWGSLEATNKKHDSYVSIKDLIKFVTQSLILVGQANIVLLYRRRLSALNGVMKSTVQAKSILKKKSELLQKENKNLFGKKFCDQISETIERLTNNWKSCWQVLFLKTLQVDISSFGITPRQANNIVRGRGG